MTKKSKIYEILIKVYKILIENQLINFEDQCNVKKSVRIFNRGGKRFKMSSSSLQKSSNTFFKNIDNFRLNSSNRMKINEN